MDCEPHKLTGLFFNSKFSDGVPLKRASAAAIHDRRIVTRFKLHGAPAGLRKMSQNKTEAFIRRRTRCPFQKAVRAKERSQFFGLGRRYHVAGIVSPVFSTTGPIDLGDDDPSPIPSASRSEEQNFQENRSDWLDAFHRFSRPHTVIGSAIGVTSVSLLTIRSPSDLSLTFLRGLFQALVPALFMNIYIVGLNQIFDVDIDKVNKPYLPLASGEISMTVGVALVIVSAIVSVGIGVLVGSRPLLFSLLVSLVLGTAYSADVPFLRWKRSAVAAASCVFAVRALVVQIGFYCHMQEFVFGRTPEVTSRPLLFAMVFMMFFSLVIALAKDLPDVEGDNMYGIRSFSVRLGREKIFWLCVWLIQGAYAVAMTVGATSPTLLARATMIIGHAVLSVMLWTKVKATYLKSKANIVSFYMFIWQLFYAEYLIIPFVR